MCRIYILLLTATIIAGSSCNKFIDADLPESRLDAEKVFNDDNTALYAVSGIYADMLNESNFASGSYSSFTTYGGLSSDELQRYTPDNETVQFQQNQLQSNNSLVLIFWAGMYKTIYNCNAVIEGLGKSVAITENVKNQLLGEAYFVRAFTYFYLVNLFGEVPIILNTDYKENAAKHKATTDQVYDQILSDIVFAHDHLDSAYVSAERVRPNKTAARALMARIYLYRKDWENAALMASQVIGNNNYSLVSLDDVFLANNNEAIWQLKPLSGGYNTNEARFFYVAYYPSYSILREGLYASIDDQDLRKSKWMGAFNTGTETVYFPAKYKVYEYGKPITEHSNVLRLAEQFLIRAEARAQLEDYVGAQQDIDEVRLRAGLGNTAASDKPSLLLAIEEERRIEFLCEWGHRWLDLKRNDRATDVLGAIKPEWSSTDELYPIPLSELQKNPLMGGQNDGY